MFKIKGLKKASGNLDEVLEPARRNGGRFPDVNEIAREVFGEAPEISEEERARREAEADLIWKRMNDADFRNNETLRDHWSPDHVITDSKLRDKRDVPKSELLPGEMSAAIYTIGNYAVRIAYRVYEEETRDDGKKIPAGDSDVRLVEEELKNNKFCLMPPSYAGRLRIFEEVSAKHLDAPGREFVIICSAPQPTTGFWTDNVTDIFTAKESRNIPDKEASLLVLETYVGDSFSVETWFKLEPSGRITKLYLHPFQTDISNARFEEIK